MQAITPEEIVEDLMKAFSAGIKLTCNCFFPSDYITDGSLSCRNKNLIFTGRIISTGVWDSIELLRELEMWLLRESTMTARDEELRLVKKNATTSNEKKNNRKEGEMSPSPDKSHGTVIGVTVGGSILVLLFSAVVTVVTVVLWQKSK